MRKINIGCANYLMDGWENYDAQRQELNDRALHFEQKDILEISYHESEEIYAGHLIEHLTVNKARNLFRKIYDESIPSVVFSLSLPVIDRCENQPFDFLQQIASYPPPAGEIKDIETYNKCRGGWHQSLWRTKDIIRELKEAGFSKVEEWPECPYLSGVGEFQLILKAQK